jgi:exosortase
VYFGLSVAMWLQLGMLALVFAALFWPNLRRLWLKTNPIWGEPNWGHAICVPIIGIYYLYVNRDELMKAGIKPLLIGGFTRNRFISAGLMVLVGLACAFVLPALGGVLARQEGNLFAVGMALSVWGVLAAAFNWGVGSLIFGILFYVYGIHPGKNDYVKDLGMVVTLFGAVLTLFGWGVMRIAWFPIAFLICALPWPGLVYSWVASPLQELAAWVAVIVLKVSGVDAYYWGTKIFVGSAGRTLNVAEACAGMRSLMTFITVGAAVAFLSSRPLWQKLFITAMSVPIAVFCNVMRVSGQGLLDTYVSYQLSESFAHQFVGIIMLIPAFFLIMLMGWLLDQLFVEEVDEAQLAAEGGKGTAMLQASQPAKPAVAAAVPVAAVPAAVASAAAGIPAAAMSGVARSAAVPPPAARSAERSGGTGVPPMVGGGQTGGGQVGGVRRIVPPGAVSRPEDKTTGPEAT